MNADRAIRWAAVIAVLAVAGVAAYVSYWHCVDVVSRNGEPGILGRLYPVCVDGIVVAASMVLLDAARHGETAPRLAWWLLGSGIAVTFAANVTYGAGTGLAGALWAAWPAAAFVGCYETLLMLVRASARRGAETPAGESPGALWAPIPTDSQNAALIALKATIAAGNPLSGRQLETRFGLSRAESARVRQLAGISLNGQHPDGGNDDVA